MAVTQLKRLELKVPKEGDPNVDLARKAYDLLGYRGLIHSKKVCGVLGMALAQLEINPYDPSRVDRYKKEKAKSGRKEARARVGRYHQISARWTGVKLQGYAGFVPEFALRKAVQIKEHVPDAIFKVEELRINTKRFDPFLTVEHAGEKYWIEVWDEPTFEGEIIDSE